MYEEELPQGEIEEEEPDPWDQPRVGATVIRLRLGKMNIETCPPLLVQHAGMLRLEAATACSHGGGFLVDNLDPKKAEAVAAALQAVGEPCFVVPAAEVVPLPRAVPVHSVHLTKTDLGPTDTVGREESAPWEVAIVLGLAGVALDQEERRPGRDQSVWSQRVGTAGAVALGGMAGVALSVAGSALRAATSTETVHKTEQRVWLDLVFLKPLRRYRIDSGQFDYSILGDQLAMTGDLNVQRLARWFLYAAPQMLTNVDGETLKQAGKVPLPHLAEKPYNEMVHWLINLVRFGRKPEG
jgi:hypothetical protein